MAKDYKEISYDELRNNYEFKLATKMLKREYPFIKDLFMLKPEEINKYSLIFVDVLVDPQKVQEYFDLPLTSWAKFRLKSGEPYEAIYLNLLVGGGDIALGFNEELKTKLHEIHTSSAIPHELKLPANRNLYPASYYVRPEDYDPDFVTNPN